MGAFLQKREPAVSTGASTCLGHNIIFDTPYTNFYPHYPQLFPHPLFLK